MLNVTDKSSLSNSARRLLAAATAAGLPTASPGAGRLGAAAACEVAAEEVGVFREHLGEGQRAGGEGGARDDAARSGAGQGGADGEGELVEHARGGHLAE